jgi:hypothetical protein
LLVSDVTKPTVPIYGRADDAKRETVRTAGTGDLPNTNLPQIIKPRSVTGIYTERYGFIANCFAVDRVSS